MRIYGRTSAVAFAATLVLGTAGLAVAHTQGGDDNSGPGSTSSPAMPNANEGPNHDATGVDDPAEDVNDDNGVEVNDDNATPAVPAVPAVPASSRSGRDGGSDDPRTTTPMMIRVMTTAPTTSMMIRVTTMAPTTRLKTTAVAVMTAATTSQATTTAAATTTK